MGKQDDLTKLYRTIKDAEVRLNVLSLNMATIQKEVNFLVNMEAQLEENVMYLKSIKIIALATEYKRTKEDLKKTKTRLSHLRTDMASNQKASKDLEALLEKYKENYDKLSKDSENNVLHGKFGKSRGK